MKKAEPVKEVLVTVSSIQYNKEQEMDQMQLVVPGKYYKKNGKHYIFYDEVSDEDAAITKNMIKLDSDTLEIRKKGAVSVYMLFQKDRKHMTFYQTPFGRLTMGILTRKICMEEKKSNLDIRFGYALEINDEHTADCEVVISVAPKIS